MEIARYADGRPLNFTESSSQFDVGGTPVAVGDVLAYEEAGQLGWYDEATRAQWVGWIRLQNQGLPAAVTRPGRKRFIIIALAVALLALCSCCGLALLGLGSWASPQSASRASQEASMSLDATASAPSKGKPQVKSEQATKAAFGEMTDPAIVDNFVAASRQIGLDTAKVKKVKRLSDWIGGHRYELTYESNGLEVYANADKTISSINMAGIHIYEEGLEPLQVKDHLVDWATYSELSTRAEEAVKTALKYPKTADFPWLGAGVARSGDVYVVAGTLSAENALGLVNDTSYHIEYLKADGGFSAEYFMLDGKKVIGTKSIIPDARRKEVATAGDDGKIVLVSGRVGTYGKAKEFDGDDYIWYHVPAGTYNVTSQTGLTKLYLDKNKTITNSDGYSECVSVRTLDFKKAGGPMKLVVSKGQHVELTGGSKVTLAPVK